MVHWYPLKSRSPFIFGVKGQVLNNPWQMKMSELIFWELLLESFKLMIHRFPYYRWWGQMSRLKLPWTWMILSTMYIVTIYAFFFFLISTLCINVKWGKGVSQMGSHKHSSHSNLSPYLLDSLRCLSGEHGAWVQHCWRGRQSSYWGGPQHLHHQDHPRGCRCWGHETEVSVYIV